jgi:hypothetical protein
MYAAAGDARKATALATSSGLAKRFMGTAPAIAAATSSSDLPVLFALLAIMLVRRSVSVAPGSTLFTVMLNCPTSFAQVLLQLATAPRTVLLTPNPLQRDFNGSRNDVNNPAKACLLHTRQQQLRQILIIDQVILKSRLKIRCHLLP